MKAYYSFQVFYALLAMVPLLVSQLAFVESTTTPKSRASFNPCSSGNRVKSAKFKLPNGFIKVHKGIIGFSCRPGFILDGIQQIKCHHFQSMPTCLRLQRDQPDHDRDQYDDNYDYENDGGGNSVDDEYGDYYDYEYDDDSEGEYDDEHEEEIGETHPDELEDYYDYDAGKAISFG